MTDTGESWLEATVRAPRHLAEPIETLMQSQGALAVTLSDEGDTPVLEPGVGETPLWDVVRVTGLFPAQVSQNRLAAVLSLAPGVESPERVSFSKLGDRNWERAWMERFKPMRFGQNLWIVPGGFDAPDASAINVRLDPGLAFGTGSHPTTRLCLEWIDTQNFSDREVIDFGCGSGILGIAAALKGARRVVCVDNDEQALIATRENARRNDVDGKIETVHADAFEAFPADFVLANILAGTLVKLAPLLCDSLGQHSRIALSGILADQAGFVIEAYAGVIGEIERQDLEGWVLLSGTTGYPAS